MLRVVNDTAELDAAMADFGERPVAVKPSGLTGGKGVKVMGPHLADHAAAREYALELLERCGEGECVLIEEKIEGAEFTIQAISDGRTVVFPNSTYDYPYRFDGDQGPGTGGMGSLSLAEPTLPFMTPPTTSRPARSSSGSSSAWRELGRHFTGVMNSGFFATSEGVSVIEFNARFGDPECMNIMSLFDGNWTETMAQDLRREADPRRRPAALRGLARPLPGLTRLRPAQGARLRVRARLGARSRRAAATSSSPRPWGWARGATGRSAHPVPWHHRDGPDTRGGPPAGRRPGRADARPRVAPGGRRRRLPREPPPARSRRRRRTRTGAP